MKRLSREEAERVLRGPEGRRGEHIEVLQRLPHDVDAELAADVAISLVASHGYHPTWVFARRCRKLPPPVIRALLAKLPSLTPRRWWAVFLQDAVRDDGDDAKLGEQFLSALDALLDLQTTYAWGSRQRKAKLKALATSARFLPSIQAAVVGDEDAPVDLLAVLAADGTDESMDAMMVRFAKAHAEQSRVLDQLELLETHAAKTPAMDTLLSSVKARLTQRNDASPALEFARSLGFDVPKFTARVSLSSTALTGGNVPRVQGGITVDSTSASWLSVHVSDLASGGLLRHRHTSFTSDTVSSDELGLGRCDAAQLPEWLSRAQATLGIRWNTGDVHVGGLRGKKRDAFAQWLFSRVR